MKNDYKPASAPLSTALTGLFPGRASWQCSMNIIGCCHTLASSRSPKLNHPDVRNLRFLFSLLSTAIPPGKSLRRVRISKRSCVLLRLHSWVTKSRDKPLLALSALLLACSCRHTLSPGLLCQIGPNSRGCWHAQPDIRSWPRSQVPFLCQDQL